MIILCVAYAVYAFMVVAGTFKINRLRKMNGTREELGMYRVMIKRQYRIMLYCSAAMMAFTFFFFLFVHG